MSREKQTTSKELKDDLLEFIRRKFYEGDNVAFNKDKRRLLLWVVLWPATWLNERDVTLTTDRYKEVFMAVMMLALQQGNTGQIKYRPAWLGKVIQSHFDCHGDEIYAEAKSARVLNDSALSNLSRLPAAPAPDPTRELALAAGLLAGAKKRVKQTFKGPTNLEFKL